MSEEDLERFKLKLLETVTFPSVYMFKFIIASEHRNIALVENLFEPETDLRTKESHNGRYVSVTAKQVVVSVDEIIDIYRRAALIKGVMFL